MRDRAMRALGAAFLISMTLTAASPLSAQRMPPGGNQNRADLEQRVQARFAEVMKVRLGLSDADAARLSRTMESFAVQRRRLHQDEQAVRARVDALLRQPQATDDEALAVLGSMEDIRERETRLLRAEQEALLQVLTPVQLVRFHGLRAQLGERVQQLRGGQGPMGGGQGGPPWRRPPGVIPPGDGAPEG